MDIGQSQVKELTREQFKKICEIHIKTQTAYCCLCGKLIKKVNDYNIEHLQPLSRQGANNSSNWRIAHKKCNSQKGALTFQEYQQWLALEAKRNGKIR